MLAWHWVAKRHRCAGVNSRPWGERPLIRESGRNLEDKSLECELCDLVDQNDLEKDQQYSEAVKAHQGSIVPGVDVKSIYDFQ